jgi:ABC-type uncharacterized transport system permease subunit
MIKNLHTFWFVLRLYIRQSLYHKRAAIGMTASWVVRMTLTIILYYHIYRLIGQNNVKGITFPVAVSGMLFFAIFLGIGFRELPGLINRENRSGNLEIWFTKPLPYLYLKVAECFGKNIIAAGLLLSLAVLGGFFCIHALQADQILLRLLAGVILLLGGWSIAIMIYGIIGLSAVFLNEIRAIENIVSKIAMVFGGAYVPVGFLPDGFRYFGGLLPTSAMTYGGQLFYPDFFTNLPHYLCMQAFWWMVLGYGLFAMNRKVRRHLNVNGG